MTIRHLLTHTSGIGYAFTNPIEHQLTQATKKPEWELPLLSDPGEKWTYSASTRVLGMVVEKITGRGSKNTASSTFSTARHGGYVVRRATPKQRACRRSTAA